MVVKDTDLSWHQRGGYDWRLKQYQFAERLEEAKIQHLGKEKNFD
jgi:hypothetical protein